MDYRPGSNRGLHRAGIDVRVTVPFFDHQHHYEHLVAVTERTRAAGFDSIWLADHLTGPRPMGSGNWVDCITLLANLAGRMPGLTYGTDVLVVGYRHPVQCAKALATVDIASGGRLIVGAGTGYLESEFANLGVPPAERAAYTDECLQVWDAIWSDGLANHEGTHFQLHNAYAKPKPVQRPRPPAWVGNSAGPVLRRAVTQADGWHPMALSWEVLETGAVRLRSQGDAAGRSTPLRLSCSGMFGTVTEAAIAEEGRRPLNGGVDRVPDDITRLRALGFTNLVFRFGFADTSNASVLEQIALVGELVLPAARAA